MASARLKVLNDIATATMSTGVQVDVTKTGLANGVVVNATSTGQSVFGLDVQATGNLLAPSSDAYGALIDVTGTGTQTWQDGHSIRGVTANTHGSCYVAWSGDFTTDAVAPYSVGVHGVSKSGTWHSVGVHGISSSETHGNYGTIGEVQGTAGQVRVGLYGRQLSIGAPWFSPLNGNYGLFATTELRNTGVDWAGWFEGDVQVTGIGVIPGGVWQLSDQNLKDNIGDLGNATAVLMQLSPKSYDYNTDQFPQLALPTGTQFGFLAQDLQAVIPEAVKSVTYQERVDSLGNVDIPALPTMVINQTTIIPFLVAAFKEQTARIDSLEAQLDQCCAQNPGLAPGGNGMKNADAVEDVQEQRLVIQPNPFMDHTTLGYYVPQAGKVSLQFSTSDGKPMGTLREEQAEAGAYTYEWNTSKLASGTYFCTYMLDGAVVVKRAVKVVR